MLSKTEDAIYVSLPDYTPGIIETLSGTQEKNHLASTTTSSHRRRKNRSLLAIKTAIPYKLKQPKWLYSQTSPFT